jgi:hypothetical protein
MRLAGAKAFPANPDEQFVPIPITELTPVALNFTFHDMGDKSPKAAQKQAAQKRAKADSAKQKKTNSAAKQGSKTKN